MRFKNVEVEHKAEIYHGGGVTTRTMVTADGEMKTLGIMQPGVYRFHTEAPETIEIVQGRCRIKIAEAQDWYEYESGQSFDIPGHSHYEIEATELLDYITHFPQPV